MGRGVGRGSGGDDRAVGGGGADIAVAFEDFFGGNVGGGVEEGGIVQYGLEIFRDLSGTLFIRRLMGHWDLISRGTRTYFTHLVVVLNKGIHGLDG